MKSNYYFLFLLHFRPLPRLPQPFYDHWHMDTRALGEFHQHLNTLVLHYETLLDDVTPLQRRGWPDTLVLHLLKKNLRCSSVLAQVLHNYLRCIFIVRRKQCAVLDTFFYCMIIVTFYYNLSDGFYALKKWRFEFRLQIMFFFPFFECLFFSSKFKDALSHQKW